MENDKVSHASDPTSYGVLGLPSYLLQIKQLKVFVFWGFFCMSARALSHYFDSCSAEEGRLVFA